MWYKLVKAVEFGVPQKRERMIIIGTRIDNVDIDSIWNNTFDEIKREIPHFFDKVTVSDAISDLPQPTEDGVISTPVAKTQYQKYTI